MIKCLFKLFVMVTLVIYASSLLIGLFGASFLTFLVGIPFYFMLYGSYLALEELIEDHDSIGGYYDDE